MKKPTILITASAALLTLCAVFFLKNTAGTELASLPEFLPQEQVAALRAEYPAHFGILESGFFIPPTLEEMIDRSDTLLHVKVLGEAAPYELESSEGDLRLLHTFFGYKLEVISDSAEIHKKGTVISVSANVGMKGLYPELKEGMEIIVPVMKYPTGEGPYGFSSTGMYYVVGDGYGLSAYSLDEAIAKDGMRVDLLLNDLWRLKKS